MRKLLLSLLIALVGMAANAQTDTIRYVKPTANGGAYANDGRSWAKAKDNIQDAINDLRTYLAQNGLHGGSVYVAAGTYEPSEGVEGGTSGQLSTSFIIYEGIHVYGGFNPSNPEASPDDRLLVSDNQSSTVKIGDLVAGDTTVVRWQMKYPTILSGNHNHNATGSFRWNSTRKRYDTRFPGNSYHVVFFASNGFINSAEHPGYADTLRYEARLDGFRVEDGNASGATDVRQGGRDHTSMGGGIYMVQGSIVENCIIQRCQAAMRGGGVYMDGGGKLYHSLIRECQTLGSGVSGGLGGGICIDNNGEVRRSWISRNVARMGGGAAILSYPENHPRGSAATYRSGDFDPYMASTLVTNNTSTTEAGGVYLDRGGIINHVTVARNENAGRDISYGRTRYGRSGGVYIYGAGQVYNSVVWGNRCDANNNIQYAATTTGVSIPSYVSLRQPFVGYTALNNLDITDFTGTARLNAYSFETDNNDVTRSGNFTLFQNPPDAAGAGISQRRLSIWYPSAKTSLSTKAVQLEADYSTQAFSVMSIARRDFFEKTFDPICTLGAIETGMEDIETAMLPPVDTADGGTEPIPTLFVNPDRVFNDPSDKSGASWDSPLDNISEAIEYFREHRQNGGKYQILVKQGTVLCAGIGSYYAPINSDQSVIGLGSIRMLPNLLLYGGFPSTLSGTTTTGRNPKEYPTRISGDIISADYNYNALHVISFSNAHDAVLDGFQIYYGNARNTSSESSARGGGIVLGNQYYPLDQRISMTGNIVRNCVIANCSGPQGAAVFAGGGYEGSQGTVSASLTMENCVISNNASSTSIIHASGNASIVMNHCTLVGNVGSLLVTSEYNGAEGTISVSNSAFHANAKTPVGYVNDITAADIPSLMLGSGVTGTDNLIDSLYTRDYTGFDKVFSFNPSNTLSYPAFTNPVRNAGVARNSADNTVYGGNADFTPLDTNPMVNRGTTNSSDHTKWGYDLTTQITRDFGGAPDIGALECHQDSTNTNGGQPTYGSVIYVRDYNSYDANGNVLSADTVTTGRDGSTWAQAINGNGFYGAASSRVNGLQYAINSSSATSGSTKPDIWVAEGKYTNKSSDQINGQYYAYSMAEGVNVFGGFPKQGNPSMNERNPKTYVSILQPQNEDPTDTTSTLIRTSAASVARVLVQPNDFSTETSWNGFTIRYGYLQSVYRQDIRGNINSINTNNIGTSGGAGVYLMEHGVLENCELLRNTILVNPGSSNLSPRNGSGGYHQAGAGAYITTTLANGEGGTLKNCVVAYNLLLHKLSHREGSATVESPWLYGAGVYQNRGIIYNTIIHDNSMIVMPGNVTNSARTTNEALVGAGAFLVSGQFYNNTIVHNFAKSLGRGQHFTHLVIPGVYVYNAITMYNSIISDNTSDHDNSGTNAHVFDVPVCAFDFAQHAGKSIYDLDTSKVSVRYSYISIRKGDTNNLCYAHDPENTNIYLDNNKGAAHSPVYTSADIYNDSTFRLVSGSPCINQGTEAIENVTIPSNDAAYADRVQDCAIDIGAYEYNGAEQIKPREGTEPHSYYDNDDNLRQETVRLAEYFVTQNGHGDASADSPTNAACATKLQRVLDAAGRYKYAHPTTHVVVRLEAMPEGGGYTPSRSAATSATEQANPRSYSIIVPLGVELQGGWPLNGDFGIDASGKLHGRDPINNITRLSGEYQSGVETVNVYHVVTFTDQVFDENGNPTGQNLSDSVKTYYSDFSTPALNKDFDRAKLDGLYIEGGRATGVSDADQRGAAAVIASYAHVADCIVRNNQASGYGGAFYMMPGSVIEGSILENNSAAYGGGIAVAETTDSTKRGIWALLLSNTLYANNATMRGGGLWFNDNARTWNSVYWLNTGAEQNDIAGVTTTTNEQSLINCPVNFCAVTNQTIAGNNNINLSPNNDNGTRWGKDTNLRQKHAYDFFLPSRASVLTRTGMPYDAIRSLARFMPGVDSVDLAGVSRLQYTAEDAQRCDTAYDGEKLAVKYNYSMEIGARALNQSFSITIDPRHPLYRLFVAHPEYMQANLSNALMESGDSTYSQQGSSFANPFLRLTDALNYIVDARKSYPEISQDQRFEVFIAEGTYYPFADMMGTQEHVRTHTFVVPEKVSLIGGIDATNPNNMYCQDTKDRDFVTIASGDSVITLVGASTDSIRLKRVRYDLNQNSVVEPWEMQHATVLSGYTEGSDLTVTNVYHVITSIADTTVVGQQPYMYSDNNSKVRTNSRTAESHYSRGARAILLDGITVTEGSALSYEGATVRNPNMYYRGGGMFIAGNYLHELRMTGVSDMMQGRRNIPVIISNSLFQNNQARLGGAIFTDGTIHIVGSSFVQNLAVSPSTSDTEDLKYVTFSGGGAIASNDTIVATNTIFANNEARDGGGSIVIDQTGTNKRVNISHNGLDANAIRGFGGMIWAGDSAAVRLINCNSVRNKAHGFASIYNCTPNSSASGPGHPHFGINCVFWGNEVDDGKDSTLMNYGNTHIGGLYFSAYQSGKGLPATVDPNKPDTLYQQTVIRGGYNDLFQLDSIFGYANHNIIISSDNDAVDGPNFTLPSNEAGIDGYMPSADWVPSRINRLCDAGWGMMRQTPDGKFIKEPNIDLGYDTDWFICGIYGFMADFYKREFNMTLLPQGDEKYMMYADESGDESSRNMERISSDPLGTVTKDFIDIGVYEYQHTLLHIADGDEVDELWVSDEETTGNNDGRTYDSPTSDLQRAIQTLLLSRNDHPKVIHIMEGTYSPISELDGGNIGFQIHTGPNPSSVALRDTIQTGHGYKATSLTILGGYSKEIEGLRDVNQYPTILKMNRRANATDANTAHLFYIGDAEQWETSGSVSGQTSGNVAMTTAVSKTSVSHGQAMPIVLDGLTFVNSYAAPTHRDLDNNGSAVSGPFNGSATAGAAIYYREQFKSEETTVVQGNNNTPAKSDEHLDALANVPKLTIRNCKFSQNGDPGTNANTVPAVFIGQGGGRALIYNSLFNNNTGAPIVSTDTVNIVNCTFAHNGGHITVKGAGTASAMANTLVWQDDSAANHATQYEGFVADSLHNNAITGISNTNENANNHNVGLSETNADPMAGPNFANISTAGGASLDFRLNPGMRTMGRADSLIYKRMTAVIRQGYTDADGRVVLRPDTTWRYDLSWGTRIYGGSLDRGAYECRTEQQRVLYVIPTKTVGTMTGTSWETAYGRGQLQTAIDAAAIYSYSHTNSNGDKTMAYVLVKGEANNTSAENSISLRDGVSVFGSIPDNYLSNITADEANDDDTLTTYLDGMIAARPGVAARSARRSRVMGVQTLDADYSNGSLLDGFEVRSSSVLSQPVVNVTQPVVLKSVIIDGNTINGTAQPAINMQDGLLYNSLVYGNKPSQGQPMLLLSSRAAVINSTITNRDTLVTAVSGNGLVANSITYNRADLNTSRGSDVIIDSVNTQSGIPFAPYLEAGVNPYALSDYITGYLPYQFQLHENSVNIGTGDTMDGILSVARQIQGSNATGVYKTINDAISHKWIDFTADRDILGNNRQLGQHIDRGCFETWRVANNGHLTATADTYPHEGSVVYVMDGATLSLGDDTGTPVFTNDNPFRPAFLLMRPGASLYSNGNVVLLSYVAVDRVFQVGQKYALVSLPFPYKVGELLRTSVLENGQIDAKPFRLEKAQTYDGSKRAAWNYHFSSDDSQCWTDMDTTLQVPANTGWLATMPDFTEPTTLRLVGYGEVDGDYVYTENGTAKSITLIQYDNRPDDRTAHFTKAENMGWNIAGLPYLVSNYTLGPVTSGSTDYSMNVPHVIYTLDPEGNFRTSQSWQDDVAVSVGTGFMTQTATSGSSETLTFVLPEYDPNREITALAKSMIRIKPETDAEEGDVLQLNPSTDANALQYTLGTDGVKMLPLARANAAIYALSAGGTPMSLSDATPVETNIPLVVNGMISANTTIDIPDTAGFNTVSHVWLMDDSTGYTVDLKQQPMMMSMVNADNAGAVMTRAMTLRLGDTKPDGTRERGSGAVHIYLIGRTLHVDGLGIGDDVNIYTISGQLYIRDHSKGNSYTTDLRPGVYVVRAAGKGQAVGVK